MLMYERKHGTLPPAHTVDDEGNPLHSWRVLLLPDLGEEELFAYIHLDEPWDSEHNRRFHDAAVAAYQCPSARLRPGETTYTVVVGERTAFRPGEGKRLDDFGMHLVLVIERKKPISWMDPASEMTEAIAWEGIRNAVPAIMGLGDRHRTRHVIWYRHSDG